MSLLGLDLNATRARAVHGAQGDYPIALPLDGEALELPLVLSLEKSTAQVGMAGRRLVREKPHLACANFLPHLGEVGPMSRTWKAGRHRLDADLAFGSVLQHLKASTKKIKNLVATVPSYLSNQQIKVLKQQFDKAKLPLLGTFSNAMAGALVGYAEHTWVHSAVVVEVDDHALTLAWIKATEGHAYLIDVRHLVPLGLRVWKDRLINALADGCVRQTRIDPRDNPAADQRLYDQLDLVMEGSSRGRIVQLGVQGQSWYQNLIVYPEQTHQYCGSLLRQLNSEIDKMLQDVPAEEWPVFLLTTAASRLPGVASLIHAKIEDKVEVPVGLPMPRKTRLTSVEDFGLDLFKVGQPTSASTLSILSPDALARAAHMIGSFLLQEQDGDHIDQSAPLPMPQPADFGPARLHFQGQEYFLLDPHTALGSQAGCQLFFDSQRHPEVDARHCEIHFDHRNFVLFNRSHEGTLVNETRVQGSTILQAGDIIRLGSTGPALRFLGQGRLTPSA